ncbi:hypothetical protein NPIL_694852 [Nephila pilipes]|uniref:Ubiquitin-like protease family profile domain-containing protein n=1 Tax=Nephila pilipes TaxID=299642 RepID=A0A8X6P8T0_NEPPI|nr:hypothetical protein NPIL_694852 [Nephila pilipes]
MNQASSNSNMPRSTVETLKQIQAKQGLSISIVGQDNSRSSFPLDSSVSKEMKPKQIVTIDKNSKLPTRSSVATENKSTLSQAKSVPCTSSESRASGAQSVLTSNQSSFQETKMPGSINKSVTPTVSSESRAFGSQSWSNPSSLATENKTQGNTIRVIQSGTPQSENKSSGVPGRVSQNSTTFTENKIQNSRVSQNISPLIDNKSQGRINQVTVTEAKNQASHRLSQSQLSFEGKVQASQNRLTVGSPPLEVKAMNSNQGRSSQTPVFVHESKSSGGQRTVNQVLNINQTKANLNRSSDIKIPNQIRVNQVKNVPVERIRPSIKSISEQSSVNVPMSERNLNNPFRVASALGTKVSASSEEKSLVKVTRVSQNISVVSENQSAAHSKISQNLSMHSESKAVCQVVKVSSVSSEMSQKSSVSFDNLSNPATPGINAMSTPRGTTVKRPQTSRVTNSTPVAKKKCTKRSSPNTSDANTKHVQAALEAASFSSDEGSPKDNKFFNMKGLTPGLTITPIRKNAPTVTGASGSITKTVSGSSMVNCPSCQQISINLNFCDHCHTRIPTTIQQIPLNRQAEVGPSYVVKNVMTTKIKQFVIYEDQNQSIQIQQAVQGLVESNPVIQVAPRSKGRPRTRRKFEEPVCYTLSSDEEEPVQVPYHPILEETQANVSQLFPVDSEGSKSEHSSTSEVLHDENQDFDDPQFPGVTDINEGVEIEEEPDEDEEEMEYENEMVEEEEEEELDESVGEEEDEIPPEENEQETIRGQRPTDYPLRCRSVRIGSYKVHPAMTQPHVPVTLATESITFRAPSLTEPPKVVLISIRSHDITKVLVHFGRCLPIMYIYTTPSFGEAVRNALHMIQGDSRYFDPTTKDDKTQKLTFLIDSMTDEQRHFIRQIFPGDKKVHEIDQKQANEILVKSTPNQVPVSKIQQQQQQQPPPNIIKLLTYPPPPQTGGIAITNEDLQCLNEGEFLNDAIIDFYLKYIFNEKLSPTQRDKTHIFSSFFYPRLTHKPERVRPGDDTTKTVQVRRHNQVKTWTRHVDIFSKDFIIIPVNQNVHWFLAIICYPGKVPEQPNVPTKSEVKTSKSSDNVTSTVEQEGGGSKVIIKELSSNGEGDSSNADDNSLNSSGNSPYLVEEPPDSDEPSPETPDSSTHPDGKQRKEMPCICIFDSLSGPNRWRIPATLRDYLEMEWKMKKGTRKAFNRDTMQGFIMKCPQQTNYSDCGMYLLQFVESFFENPIPYFGNPMPDLTNWFSEVKISKKRQQLKDLIISIHRKQLAAANANARKNQPDGVQSSPSTVQQTDNR